MIKDEILKKIGIIINILKYYDENKFKILAYEKVIDIIEKINENELISLLQEKRITEVEGIGKGISEVLYEIYENGNAKIINEFVENYGEEFLDLFKIKGLGVKNIKKLFDLYGVNSFDKLDELLASGVKLKEPKLKESLIKNIREQIPFLKESKYKYIYPIALRKAERMKKVLEEIEGVEIVEFTGEIERYAEVVNFIEMVVLCNGDLFNELVKNFGNVEQRKIKLFDLELDIYLIYYDGAHYKLYHVYGKNDLGKVIKLTRATLILSEPIKDLKIFEKFIPEMWEIENIGKEVENEKIVKYEDIVSVLHFHTNWSDGSNTLEEMFDGIEKSKFEIAGVCDHSKSSFWANGLSEEEVLQQHKVIEELQKKYRIKLLKGIECDIHKDGSLDYGDGFLKEFDFVVAAIHQFTDDDEEFYTKRMIKAIENQYVNIIAHPTGRLLLTRLPYPIDIYKVIDACASNNVAIEINSTPSRMDLSWKYLDYAMNRGARFAINPDAHSTQEIFNIEYGVKSARKAGVYKEYVINTYKLDELLRWFNK
ncbi:MAG TPA: PHP domain-containing protein [Ignavibacteriales bacterium]|nr:PHP domain-containing protein [Ignavibacteriales bacterium]